MPQIMEMQFLDAKFAATATKRDPNRLAVMRKNHSFSVRYDFLLQQQFQSIVACQFH